MLNDTIKIGTHTLQNRVVLQPMEACDCENGAPSQLTVRKYMRFAESGAGLIWFEANGVCPEGLTNPGQMQLTEQNTDRFKQLLDDMKETLVEANGVGLAAPQVGILRRVVVVDVGEEMLELVNPELIETDGEQEGPEGCLSVPGRYGLVKRPYYAKVRAQDRFGEWFEAEGEELIGRCFCHELDHLDGILYTQVMERFLTEEELESDED